MRYKKFPLTRKKITYGKLAFQLVFLRNKYFGVGCVMITRFVLIQLLPNTGSDTLLRLIRLVGVGDRSKTNQPTKQRVVCAGPDIHNRR